MAGDRSILIAVEGIDGAGKTTQVRMLREALESAGLGVLSSREPTAGVHGRAIRQSAENGRLEPDEELRLFIEDRKEHVAQVIRPALEAGKIVILDRYYYSTIAYQGSRGADVAEIRRQMEAFAPVPDAVFLIDVEPLQGLYRIAEQRGDTPNEFETAENLTAVRRVFASLDDTNIVRVDGSPRPEWVHQYILDAFIEGPLKAKLCAKSYGCDDPTHCGPRFTGECEWWNLKRSLVSSVVVP